MSTGCGSRLAEPVNAAGHFLMIDQVAAIGGGDGALYAFHETGLPFEHAYDRLFHHLRGVGAFAGNKFLELRFGMRSKVNFHGCQFRSLWT